MVFGGICWYLGWELLEIRSLPCQCRVSFSELTDGHRLKVIGEARNWGITHFDNANSLDMVTLHLFTLVDMMRPRSRPASL